MEERGKLYVVGTPIGNLGDITHRALEVLGSVDMVLAEDTRVAKKLLSRFDISIPVKRCDARMERKIKESVIRDLKSGRDIALVSDSGTPGVSDPGSFLVNAVREAGCSVIPVPGVSSVTTFLSVAGIGGDRFTFLGYPPHKKGRKAFFEGVRDAGVRPVILFESPHRILKTLSELGDICGKDARVVAGRELTKIHEEFFSGTLEGAREHFKGEKERGEFILGIL